MYYLLMLAVMIIGLLPVILFKRGMYGVVCEVDKSVFIKNRKPGYITWAVKWINELVFLIFLILIPVLAATYLGTVRKNNRNMYIYLLKLQTLWLITIPVFAILLEWLLYKSMMVFYLNIDIKLLFIFTGRLYYTFFWISVVYWIIFGIKQFRVVNKRHKQSMQDYEQYFEKGMTKNQKWDRVEQEDIRDEFAKDYCRPYATGSEWKTSDYTVSNFGGLSKFIIVYAPLFVLGLSMIVSTIQLDILNGDVYAKTSYQYILWDTKNRMRFTHNYPYPGMTHYYSQALLCINIVKVGLLTWAINPQMILMFKQRSVSKKNLRIIVQTLIVGYIIILLALPIPRMKQEAKYNTFVALYYDGENENNLEMIPYKEEKENVIAGVEHLHDYGAYTEDEKLGYIMKYIGDFIDDLEELGFTEFENEWNYHGDGSGYVAPLKNGMLYDSKEVRIYIPANIAKGYYITMFPSGYTLELSASDSVSGYYIMTEKELEERKAAKEELSEYPELWDQYNALDDKTKRVVNRLFVSNEITLNFDKYGYEGAMEKNRKAYQTYIETRDQVQGFIDTLFEMEMEDRGIEI